MYTEIWGSGRMTGQDQATHLSWPRDLVCLEGSGRGQAGAQEQGENCCCEQQGPGQGCRVCRAEARAGCICVFMCVYIIYMGTMYTESTGALRDQSRERVGEMMPQIPERAEAA